MKTLLMLVDEYLDYLHCLKYSQRTLQKKKLILGWFTGWLEKSSKVTTADGIQQQHLEAWQQHLSGKTSTRGFPLKPSSINSCISVAKSFLIRLAQHGYVLRILPETLKRVREPQMLFGSVLSHEQVMKLIRKVNMSTPEGYRNRAILELLYSSGLRAAEVLALDVGDINFEHGTALVFGKGSKERIVPIGRTALRYLESYVKAVRPFFVHNSGEQALFLSKTGNRLAYHNLKYMLHVNTSKANLETRVTPHTFRRSCATEMIRGGANVYHVKELLGHETLSTMKHYAKLTIVDLKKTHEKCHPRERGDG